MHLSMAVRRIGGFHTRQSLLANTALGVRDTDVGTVSLYNLEHGLWKSNMVLSGDPRTSLLLDGNKHLPKRVHAPGGRAQPLAGRQMAVPQGQFPGDSPGCLLYFLGE